MLTSNRASIDQRAQDIHHRTMLQATAHVITELIKHIQEDQFLFWLFLYTIAIVRGIVNAAMSIIQKYDNDWEYAKSKKLLTL